MPCDPPLTADSTQQYSASPSVGAVAAFNFILLCHLHVLARAASIHPFLPFLAESLPCFSSSLASPRASLDATSVQRPLQFTSMSALSFSASKRKLDSPPAGCEEAPAQPTHGLGGGAGGSVHSDRVLFPLPLQVPLFFFLLPSIRRAASVTREVGSTSRPRLLSGPPRRRGGVSAAAHQPHLRLDGAARLRLHSARVSGSVRRASAAHGSGVRGLRAACDAHAAVEGAQRAAAGPEDGSFAAALLADRSGAG